MNEVSTFATMNDKNVDNDENQQYLSSTRQITRNIETASLTDYAKRFFFEIQETYGNLDTEDQEKNISTSENIHKKPRELRAFKALQKWRGYIEDFNDETFTARLKDLKSGGNDELFEYNYFDLSSVNKNDLKVGKVFYLSVGYIDYAGTIEKSMRLRFQKKIDWDEGLIDNVAKDVQSFLALPEKQ